MKLGKFLFHFDAAPCTGVGVLVDTGRSPCSSHVLARRDVIQTSSSLANTVSSTIMGEYECTQRLLCTHIIQDCEVCESQVFPIQSTWALCLGSPPPPTPISMKRKGCLCYLIICVQSVPPSSRSQSLLACSPLPSIRPQPLRLRHTCHALWLPFLLWLGLFIPSYNPAF